MTRRWGVAVGVFVLVLGAALTAGAQAQGGNQGFVTVQEILDRSCAACHGEVAGHQELLASRWVVPGSAEQSPLYLAIANDSMPPGEPLPVTEKNLLRSWIAAGAEATDAPIAVILPGDGGAEAPQAATAGAEAAGAEAAGQPGAAGAAGATPGSQRFLGFSSKTRFHQVSGFTSGGLLLAAGVVGAVQYGTLIAEGHALREELGLDDEDQIGSQCSEYISSQWANPMHTALRWTHVGLLAAGETLYLANAVTGLGMLTPDRPGLTPQDLHRYAFFTHGALMIAELIMGFLTTSVLESGTHEQVAAFGIVHSAIGLAIPVVVIASGIAINGAMK